MTPNAIETFWFFMCLQCDTTGKLRMTEITANAEAHEHRARTGHDAIRVLAHQCKHERLGRRPF